MANQQDLEKITVGDKEISFQTKTWVEQANGSVLIRTGDTVVLVTAVMSAGESDKDYFPLMVDFEEKFYATGKILGSRFVRREGRATDEATIAARITDRAIRPLFPTEIKNDVQVIATVLSFDGENDPDVLGLIGSSLALGLSNIPWKGPLGAARVGKVDGNYVLNPTYSEREQSDIDFVFAVVKRDGDILVNMIEAESSEVSETDYEEALSFAKPHLLSMIEAQEKIVASQGKEKLPLPEKPNTTELEQDITKLLGDKVETALFTGEPKERINSVELLRKEVLKFVEEQQPEMKSWANGYFESIVDTQVHKGALEKDKRVDDRKMDEIRPLAGEVGLLPRTHGTGLFTRGQTTALSVLTLGSPADAKLTESMEGSLKKRYMHHYNFPPYAPGETKPLRGPGRREIGHGILAEKGLLPVLPTSEEFPYTIRIVTEIMSSNGSTSMAAACGSTLALMDAGVPIKRPVAGISVGMMSDQSGTYKLLTDIQGPEDHYGDMDFKVAGSSKGITAIQLDVKVDGVSPQIFSEVLQRAKGGRLKILDEVILKAIPEPRKELSQWAPKIQIYTINPSKIGMVVGSGGKTINKIIADFEVQVDIEDTGEVFVSGEKAENVQSAIDYIATLTKEAEVGERYEGKVTRIMDFGAFVEIFSGTEGLVHISQLADNRVDKVEDVVKVGDTIPVKVIEIDELGRVNLSLKQAKEDK